MPDALGVLLAWSAMLLAVASTFLHVGNAQRARNPLQRAVRSVAAVGSLYVAVLYGLEIVGLFHAHSLPGAVARPAVIFLLTAVCAYAISER